MFNDVEQKLVAAKEELVAEEKEWMNAQEESVKSHYFSRMESAQKMVSHLTDRLVFTGSQVFDLLLFVCVRYKQLTN